MNKKKKILVLNGQYLPGYKGGGPIQSCVNMIENLSDKFEFYVLTADRDFKSDKPYENIKINDWNKVGSAKVFYMSPEKQNLKGFNKILESLDFDIIYLNGFFSPIFTIKPLILKWFGKLKAKKVILTPRGDFTGGCENKKVKKYSYIYLCKLIGLYNGLTWHATSKLEEEDIRKRFKKANIFTVPNLSAKYELKDEIIEKKVGKLELVFISRIFPKKNLKYAIEILKEIKEGNIVFDIYGPMEDKSYWDECKNIIEDMSDNIKIKYNGELPHCEISNVLRKYHAFFFPTLGENYGHAIVESMMNNCLVVLSKDVTPWNDYSIVADSVASLNDKTKFIEIINKLVSMDDKEFKICVDKNIKYIRRKLDDKKIVENYVYYLEN